MAGVIFFNFTSSRAKMLLQNFANIEGIVKTTVKISPDMTIINFVFLPKKSI